MYKEPNRWAMPFQTYVTLTMLQTHTMATEKPVKLMERSMYSAKFVKIFKNYVAKIECYSLIGSASWRICCQVVFCIKRCTI